MVGRALKFLSPYLLYEGKVVMSKTTFRFADCGFLLAGALAAVVGWAIWCPCESLGDEPESKEDAQAKAALKAGDTFTPTNLEVRLSDDFEKDYPAPHHMDMTRWTKWKGEARTRNGQCILTPTPPGTANFAGIGTRKKDFAAVHWLKEP